MQNTKNNAKLKKVPSKSSLGLGENVGKIISTWNFGESLFWLCADCVNRKSEDDRAQVVYKDYVNTAKQLEREISSTFHAWKVIKGWVIAFLISGFAFQISYAVAPINKYRSKDLNAGMVIVSLIIVVSAYGIPITWVSKRNKWIREHEEIRAVEIEKPKHGFQEFYVNWKK